jgi:hypothetical protein
MASFNLVLQTSGSLHADGEPDRFISEYRGVISCTRDRDGRACKVGRVKAYRIHADLAFEAGEPLFDVCDAHSQQLHDIYAALFDATQDDLHESVRERFDVLDNDVLVLDYVLLSPRWRGLKLGLLAARKLIDMVGGGCGLVVSWIYPLNPDAAEFLRVPNGWIPRHAGKDEEREARRKLRQHFRALGFRRVGKTRFDVLSLSRVSPTLSDLIQPGR